MSAELLLREFERVGEALEAPRHLYELVLDLAVRGRLVHQDHHEDSAAAFLTAQGVVPARLADAAAPFPIPPGWSWLLLGSLMRGEAKAVDPAATPDTRFCLWSVPSFSLGKPEIALGRDIGSTKRLHTTGDLLLSKINPHLNRVWLTGGFHEFPQIASSEWIAVDPHGMSRELLRYFLMSPFFLKEFCSILTGIGGSLRRVRPSDAMKKPLPIPPLAEQHRIVAKVAELLARCDELDIARTERESRRDRLRTAALKVLTAPDDVGWKESSRLFFSNSSRILTKPEHVAAVRQTILDLAVRGGLLPQREADGPVRKELTEADGVRAEAARLDRRATSERQTLLAADMRWHIPAGWEWRGLADLVLFIDYRGRTPAKTTTGIRLITAKNVRPGRVSLEPEEFISPEEYARWMTRGLPKVGDVLFTTEAPMGNAAVVRLDESFALAQRVIDLRSYGAVDAEFLALQLTATPFRAVLDATATGLTAKGIKAAKLKRLPIAVPPLAEQHRIVRKVSELTAACHELEICLESVSTGRSRLLASLLRDALNGAAGGGGA